jgi:hypothetical protein
MWSNFSAMPGFLKFLTAHAFGMSVLLVASVIPHGSFVLHGRPVSYAEWWSSGAGPLASFLGIILPISGFLLLRRNPLARIAYLTSIGIAMIRSRPLQRSAYFYSPSGFGISIAGRPWSHISHDGQRPVHRRGHGTSRAVAAT